MYLNKQQRETVITEAKHIAGAGWGLLGLELQRALIAQRAIAHLLMQLADEMKPGQRFLQEILEYFEASLVGRE